MTIQERLIWVKRLNMAQFVINLILFAFVVVIGFIVVSPPAVVVISGDGTALFVALIGFFIVVFVFLIAALHAALPLLANFALTKRQKGWTWAAYAFLIYSTITGGGIITILSLISFVLLCDNETYTYLTGESWGKRESSPQPAAQM